MSAGCLNDKSLSLKALTVNGVPITGGSGVTSLNTLQNAIGLVSADASITFENDGQNINIQAKAFDVDTIVQSITTAASGATVLRGNLTFTSTDGSIILTPSPQGGNGSMDFSVNPPPPPAAVTSLEGLDGPITFSSTDGSVSFNPANQIIDLTVNFPTPPESVTALNGLAGPLNLTSPDSSVTILPVGDEIQLTTAALPPGVTSITAGVDTVTGGLTFTSSDSTITITANGLSETIDFKAVIPTPQPIRAGIYTEATGGVTSVNITATGVTASSVVVATYIHPATGGASQYIQIITPSANNINIHCNTPISIGDQINWIAYG